MTTERIYVTPRWLSAALRGGLLLVMWFVAQMVLARAISGPRIAMILLGAIIIAEITRRLSSHSRPKHAMA